MNSSKLIRTIDSSGNIKYFDENRLLHRLDGPALKCPNGDMHWYKRGQIHREDGPARELSNGVKLWYQHGKLHRLDGSAIEGTDGTKGYCIRGVFFEAGGKYWYKKGELHRMDGPAVSYVENDKTHKEWWIGGRRFYDKMDYLNYLNEKFKSNLLLNEEFFD